MNTHDFEKSFEARVEMCRRVLIGKNVEYARAGDKLHNFKEAGKKVLRSPEDLTK